MRNFIFNDVGVLIAPACCDAHFDIYLYAGILCRARAACYYSCVLIRFDFIICLADSSICRLGIRARENRAVIALVHYPGRVEFLHEGHYLRRITSRKGLMRSDGCNKYSFIFHRIKVVKLMFALNSRANSVVTWVLSNNIYSFSLEIKIRT